METMHPGTGRRRAATRAAHAAHTYHHQNKIFMNHSKLLLLLTLMIGGGNVAHSAVSYSGTAPSLGLPQVAETLPTRSGDSVRVAKAYGATFEEACEQFCQLVDAIRENEEKQFTDDYGAYDILEDAIMRQQNVVSDATTVEEVDAAISTLKDALKAFVANVTLEEYSEPFDLTCLMVNPTPTSNADGWTVKGNADFYSSYDVADFRYQGSVGLSQVLPGMPGGHYTLEANALSIGGGSWLSGNGQGKETEHLSSSSYKNISQVANTIGYITSSVDFVNGVGHDLTVSLESKEGQPWLVWRGFKLKYNRKVTPDDCFDALYNIIECLQEDVDNANGSIPSNILDAFNEFCNNYIDSLWSYDFTEEEMERMVGAVDSVTNAIASLKAMKAEWSTHQQFCDQVRNLMSVSTGDEAKETLTTAIENETTDFDRYVGIDIEAFREAIAASEDALRTAAVTYISTAELASIWSSYDITFLIHNPQPTVTTEGWTVSDPDALTFHREGYGAAFSGAAGASLSQTLPWLLPVGEYNLRANASTGEGMTATLAANDQSMEVQQVSYDSWEYNTLENNLDFVLDAPQEVTVSLTADATTGDHRLVWSSFTLSYSGKNELKAYKEAYQAALDEAETVMNNLPLCSSELQALWDATGADPGSTAESLQEATERVKAATEVARAALPAFRKLDKEVGNAEAFDDIDVSELEDLLWFGTGETLITADEAIVLYNELKGKESESFNSTYTTDLSYLLNDWNSGREDGSTTLFNAGGQHWSGDTNHGYWDLPLDKYEKDWRDVVTYSHSMSKSITLPAGKYGFKFAGRATASDDMDAFVEVSWSNSEVSGGMSSNLQCSGYTGKGIDMAGNTNYGDGSFANDDDGYGWEWSYALFTIDEPMEVTIEFKGAALEAGLKMGLADLSIFAAAESTSDLLELQDEATEKPATGIFKAVTYGDRTLYGGWNSIVLPFDATLDEVGATAAYSFEGTTLIGGSAYRIDLASVGEGGILKANTPYIIRMAADKTGGLTFPAKAVVPSEEIPHTAESNGFTMVGTYVAHARGKDYVDFIEQGDYIVGHEGFVKAHGGNQINAFRAYLDNAYPGTNEAKGFAIDGGEVTGIDAIAIESAVTGKAYNLQGQQVENPRHGVFIINGRKVVVK